MLDAVFRHLELIENEYFSLQFTEIFQLQHHIRQEHRFLIDDVGFEASKITKNNELSQETIFDNETIKENQTSFQSLKNQYFHTDQKTIVHSVRDSFQCNEFKNIIFIVFSPEMDRSDEKNPKTNEILSTTIHSLFPRKILCQ